MKMDKDTLKKNGFWIGLGAFVALWLIAVLTVKVAGGDTKAKADWEAANKAITAVKDPKTPAFNTPWQEFGKKFADRKDKVWKEAWDSQAPMYTWPDGMPISHLENPDDPSSVKPGPAYPSDRWGDTEQADLNNRSTYKTTLYGTQFEGLDKWVYPVEFNGGVDNVIPRQKWDEQKAPTREECWLAQEDLWVRRDLMLTVRDALDSVARFKPVKSDDKKEALPSGVLFRHHLRNANWELDLLFEKGARANRQVISDKSQIKNVNVDGKTLILATPKTNKGIFFRFTQGEAAYFLEVAGEPLAAGSSMTLKAPVRVDTVDFSKPFEVDQVFAWDNCPVRRIDLLALGAHSHRTVVAGLKIREDLKKLDPEPVEETSTTGAGPTGMAGAPMGMAPGGMMGSAAGKPGMAGPGGTSTGSQPAGDLTRINGINRARYVHVTEQCRHLPVSMRVVVEQAHIQDMLTAVANSHLRVQITQVQLAVLDNVRQNEAAPTPGGEGTRTGEGGRPMPMGGSAGGPPAGMPAMPKMPAMPGSGRGPLRPSFPMMPGMPGPMGMGEGGKPVEGTAQAGEPAVLVELTIYGIASLYERFPPKKEAGAPTTTPAPGAPGAPAPGAPAPGTPAPTGK